MNALELIRHRRSVRTFDGNPLRPEDAEKLMAFARSAGNPYDIPIEWRLLNAKTEKLSSPVITGTETFIAGKMTRVPHAEEAFGIEFEKIVLYAEYLGFGTTWIAGTMDRKAFERAMELKEGEVMPCISPLGYPAARMSLREVLMRKGVKADRRMNFEELFFDGSFDKPLMKESAGSLTDTLEMVRLAPSAVNKQPWRVVLADGNAHFYEKRSKGYLGADGWDLQLVDMGIAMCHFLCGTEEAGRQAELVLSEPDIQKPEGVFYTASIVIKD